MFVVTVLVVLALATAVAEAKKKIEFSLQLKGRGKIDETTGAFHIHAKGGSQTDDVKITPQHGIEFSVLHKIGSYAEIHARSYGANNDAVVGNFSLGTHLSRDHVFEFGGGYTGDNAGKKTFFAMVAVPFNGKRQFHDVEGRIAASGRFEDNVVANATTDDLHGVIHFTFFGEADSQ
jgi:hypothetical protein